jgi:twitching motility protein PilI
VANLRGQLHGVVDLAEYLGLPLRQVRNLGEVAARDAGRLIALNAGLQINTALLIDRLMGLRNAGTVTPDANASQAGRPHFVSQQMSDAQGRTWYELDLAGLVADEAFLKIDV